MTPRASTTRNRLLVAAVVAAAAIGIVGQFEGWWRNPSTGTSSGPTPSPATGQAQTSQSAPATTTQTAPPDAASAKVPVAKPKVQTISDTLEITGNAAAVSQVKLVARVVGYLEKIHFEDGALVRKGDLLFTIQQDQWKAQLQQAKAQLQLQQAALSYAKTEVQRYTELVKRSAAPQIEIDHWVFEKESAEANILAAQAQIAIAQLNLDYTEVRAPFDGQMSKHLIDPGNVVGATTETALAQITQLDPIYVEANISSQQALQIRTNLDQRRLSLEELHKVPVDVALANETGFPLHGTLQYVAPQIDPATGTLLVRALLANPNRILVPGIFAKMRIPMGKEIQRALLVPDRALQEDQGGRYLLVLDKDDIVRQRYVQIGQQVGALRVILGGLDANDRVVIGELWRSTPGTKVSPQLKSIDG
ncbi:RND family efflux transporter, MFP subunit [Enhydrobacter aerosaccus]|uniref:RND family efflux transporter, MFP subunit n=1 Tax=Enhydrobacter aerosaccus TaxID=225324 RepID=A0A1T4NIQ5_9HYPH|nr:efflux RND transporter periplasmic adaptor subunit [Enhydrobacter aerosaccus]SJZ79114.1 RND family efflux transporter, MFP subunit [Enhydrobacter aerosaccus]